MKNTRKKLKYIHSKTKRNIKKMGGASTPVKATAPLPTTASVTAPAPTTATVTAPATMSPTTAPVTIAPATLTTSPPVKATSAPVIAPVTTTPVPATTVESSAPEIATSEKDTKEDVSKLLSDIESKINALPDTNTNKAVFTKILSQLKQVELNDTIIETLRTFLSKIDSIKIIDPNKINEINTKLTVIEEEIKENTEIKTNNEKIASSQGEEGESDEPALSGKLAHLTFPIELLDAVKNCINHARNYDFVKVGPTGEELIE